MTLSYAAGLAKVLEVARQQHNTRQKPEENVPLQDAIGGVPARAVLSPRSIPEYDTSAMDGYAIRSHDTTTASPDTPVVFRVMGTVAAGDEPENGLDAGPEDGVPPCVEIMTGAIFPEGYDACVKVEDTVAVRGPDGRCAGCIAVTRRILSGENKRFAGSDIRQGHAVLKQGDTVQPAHILPLASLGVAEVPLVRRARVGVWSTGKEMTNGKAGTKDANGPYLTAAIKEMGLEAEFLGVLDDDLATLRSHIRKAADAERYDLLLTSGAVSKGRFDYIRAALDEMGTEIMFHGLYIRPGHPVLFGLVPSKESKAAFFGLPGNPGAAAACFRLLTVPYLRALQGQPQEQPIWASLRQRTDKRQDAHSCASKQNRDIFRHGVLSTSPSGGLFAEASNEQSPAKLGPFRAANCWIRLPLVECYPISPTGAIRLAPCLPN
ncbi:e8baf4e9-807d-405e-a7e8-71c6db521291 [Thermothielavioides terrestris]|uniref:molybdopterin adenylyltransferase n=1 Tax=Thermothielavioides terrestris TaxID=2587410 RepID=A0A3S4ATJ6_9PEZI|nr:e8baf4e9-807d-405e-a7e8-71c6db521291 [Thermothielavioides terrestris]